MNTEQKFGLYKERLQRCLNVILNFENMQEVFDFDKPYMKEKLDDTEIELSSELAALFDLSKNTGILEKSLPIHEIKPY